MALTAAEFRLLSEAREDARQIRGELGALTVAFATHCAAEESANKLALRRGDARAPWLAAIAAWAAVAVAVWTSVVR